MTTKIILLCLTFQCVLFFIRCIIHNWKLIFMYYSSGKCSIRASPIILCCSRKGKCSSRIALLLHGILALPLWRPRLPRQHVEGLESNFPPTAYLQVFIGFRLYCYTEVIYNLFTYGAGISLITYAFIDLSNFRNMYKWLFALPKHF